MRRERRHSAATDEEEEMSNKKGLVSVGNFKNETDRPLVLHLEMLCAEVHLSPGHEIELLAVASPELLPVSISVSDGALSICPNRVFDPEWHVRFKGKLISAGWPTMLSEHE